MSERGYRVRVQYPNILFYRYLGLDVDGWYTTNRDRARVFETEESANMALSHYLPLLPKKLVEQSEIKLEPIPAFDPDWVTRPSSHLLELLQSKGIDTQIFEDRVSEVQAVLLDDCPITDDIADLLSLKLETSKQYWLNLESNYREGLKMGLKVV